MVETVSPTDRRALRYPRRLPSLLNRLVSMAVVTGDGPDMIRTKRLFTTAMWASLFTSVGSTLLLAEGAPWAAAATVIPFLTAAISLMRCGPAQPPTPG